MEGFTNGCVVGVIRGDGLVLMLLSGFGVVELRELAGVGLVLLGGESFEVVGDGRVGLQGILYHLLSDLRLQRSLVHITVK